MLRQLILIICCALSIVTNAQIADSLPSNQQLEPLEIIAYFNQQPILGLTASAQTITTKDINAQQTTTLLPALNAVAGIRMEERSPGSYRIAMRGSLIRSPFGIRNTKIYIDEFPLTDAGGNTYINLLDPASISSIHVVKGPDGSLYGASSGGVIRVQPNGFNWIENQGSLLISGGSFGLFQEQLSVQRKVSDHYSFSFDQSITASNGYRNNSALNKKTFQTAHRYRYTEENEIRFFALYADLDYQTPGGLTKSQMQEDPTMSRPAAGPNPSAEEQKAGIHNKTFFSGITHVKQFKQNFSHVISIFGSYTDFENPFITNYEYRTEKNMGVRTYFSFIKNNSPDFKWEMQMGFEGIKGWYRINNYDNEKGIATTPQAMDDLDNSQNSFFYRAMLKLYHRWRVEASVGLNHSTINFKQRFPLISNAEGKISFGNIWMPRVATSYLLQDNWAVRASVSKGYSPPTIAEVRSSDNNINTVLTPETGINYEVGLRWEAPSRELIADVSYYYYNMKNGIVRQLRESGAEYYVNAGEIKQNGVEISVWAQLIGTNKHSWIRSLSWQTAAYFNHYRFGDYRVNNDNYSQNKVTAVPDWVWVNTLQFTFPLQLSVNITHNYTSNMPLNDANTVFAEKFHLVQLKANWHWQITPSYHLHFFAGIDNLLNENYSLGNDINAFGNRFFNPSPTRNYYAGIKIGF